VLVDSPGAGRARLVVEDDGPGIAADRVERGVSGGGSTGLGLDIVRRTAEASGGRLLVERAAGGGARVVVELGMRRA
jgi:signal transduction histidine kinase